MKDILVDQDLWKVVSTSRPDDLESDYCKGCVGVAEHSQGYKVNYNLDVKQEVRLRC